MTEIVLIALIAAAAFCVVILFLGRAYWEAAVIGFALTIMSGCLYLGGVLT